MLGGKPIKEVDTNNNKHTIKIEKVRERGRGRRRRRRRGREKNLKVTRKKFNTTTTAQRRFQLGKLLIEKPN